MTLTVVNSITSAYQSAITKSHRIYVYGELWGYSRTVPGSGAKPLATFKVESGQIVIDRNAPVRRQLNAVLTETVAWDSNGNPITITPSNAASIFWPTVNEIRIFRGIQYPNGDQEVVPQGVFGFQIIQIEDASGDLRITVTGKDRAATIQRHGIETALNYGGSIAYYAAVNGLMQDGDGLVGTTPVWYWMDLAYGNYNTTVGSTGTAPVMFNPGSDRLTGIMNFAEAAGCEFYFDRTGVPQFQLYASSYGGSVSWYYDTGVGNIATKVTRIIDRNKAPNVVIRTGQGLGMSAPVTAYDYDNNSTSPTYVGGSYGVIVDSATSPLLTTVAQCQAAATRALYRNLGCIDSVLVEAIPKPDQDVGDVISVYDQRAGLTGQEYVLNRVTMPLDTRPMLLEGRLVVFH